MAKKFSTTYKKSVKEIILFPFAWLWNIIKNAFYDVEVAIVKLFRKITGSDKKVKMRSTKSRFIGECIFVYSLLLYPLVQFSICYVSVNVNSILMAFQRFVEVDEQTNEFVYKFYFRTEDIFFNFKNFFKTLTDETGNGMQMIVVQNSLVSYAVTTFIYMPLNLIFSYVIYKKIPGSGFFQVILYLPQMISSIVISMLFQNFVTQSLPIFMHNIVDVQGFPSNPLDPANESAFGVNLFYSVWAGFGTQLILYAGAMARIPDSLIEFGELEGISMFKEFIFVVLPMIYSTITVFLVTGIAGIFIDQLSLFNFYGATNQQRVQTIGYYIYTMVIGSNGSSDSNKIYYPEAAAAGLSFTLLVAPITLVGRYLLEKFGPTVEF